VARFVIILVIAAVVVGLLWPVLIRFSRGRLPGDTMSERKGRTYFAPIAACVVLSLLISSALWWLGH